jgi:hypothetical protein
LGGGIRNGDLGGWGALDVDRLSIGTKVTGMRSIFDGLEGKGAERRSV